MRMLRLALFTSFAGALALGAGCTAEFTGAEETGGAGGMGGSAGTENGGTGGTTGGTGGTGGVGGTASAGGTAGSGGGCSGAATPSEDSCVVTEDYGVFVSPAGDDTTADGSRDAPYATLEAALSAAYTAGKRVYACSSGGDFIPNGDLLVIDDGLSGSQMYGGFDCDSWAYDGEKPTAVVGGSAALFVNSVKGGLRVEDFSFRAVDQDQTSSIGALVKDSEGVLFKRVTFIAGKGADGTPGVSGLVGDPGPAPGDGQRGAAALCTAAPASQVGGAWANPSSCGSLGGEGGTARKNQASTDGLDGEPKMDVVPSGGNANGGAAASVFGVDATSGTQGAQGEDGANGSPVGPVGTFHQDGYDPPVSGAGLDGHVGQGGGGGGASAGNAATCIGASGGAGGMGGCGGGHGAGGEGGHASIALLVWQSTVTVTDCVLESAAGGAGGAGGDGATGGTGGEGGPGGAIAPGVGEAGKGGKGGRGGNGGSGAGGPGGPSYGLVYGGTKPAETNSCTFSVGVGGKGGAGGRLGSLTPAPDGPDGASAEMYEQT